MSGATGRSSARPVRRVDVRLYYGGPRPCQARHAATAKGGAPDFAVVSWVWYGGYREQLTADSLSVSASFVSLCAYASVGAYCAPTTTTR